MSPSVSVRLLLTQSDARLLAFAQAGHERAYEALVKRYRKPLLAYCRRLLLSEERAEDALQQALLQAWLALQAGTDVGDVKAWLYRIVHNAALNVLRVSGYDYYQLNESLSGADAPQADLDRRIAVREALAGLAALPEMQREALLRTAVEGHTHQQVAKELGVSENALRGLVYRARASMRAAAGALTPSPLVSWALTSGTRGTPAVERLAEIGAGGGSAGLAGLLIKGGAVAVTASALAGGIVAGHTHRHAAKHAKPHPARLASSAARPAAARTELPASGATVAADVQARAEQPSHSHGRQGHGSGNTRLRHAHVIRQPSSVLPPIAIPTAPVAPTSNDPKSKNHQGRQGEALGDSGKTDRQSPNGPDGGGATKGNQGSGGHADGRGEQGSNDDSGQSGHGGKDTSGSEESGDSNPSGISGGSQSPGSGSSGSSGGDGPGGSNEASSGKPQVTGSPGGKQDEGDTNSNQPEESREHRGSSDATPPTSTGGSPEDEHDSQASSRGATGASG
jgi:RNA polymerase sigma factor (sigma-70 family)